MSTRTETPWHSIHGHLLTQHFELSHFERIFVRKVFRNSIDGQWWTIHVPSMAIDGICNDHLQIGSIGGQAWTIHGHGWNAMESQYGYKQESINMLDERMGV